MKNYLKNKMFGRTLSVLSLALMMAGSLFVNVPLVHAETSVANQAELIAAVANVDEAIITLTANITLTSTLIVGRTVTINGAGFTLTRIANNVTDIESYAIMVSAGTLTASNLKIVSETTGTNIPAGSSAVGITVQTGASLNLSGSTITAKAVYGLAYGVYAQTGATAVTLNTNQFIFSGADTTGSAHRIMLGMTGIGTAVSLTSNTITSTLHTGQEEIKLAVCADGTDCGGSGSTLAAIKTFAETGNKVAVGEKLRATASDATTRAIYTRTATGWTTPVTDETELLAALAGSSDIVLSNDITLSTPLSISRTVTIDGGALTEFDLKNSTITTSGNVTLENMTLTGTANYQPGDGNYGIWVASGTLIADNIHMTVVTSVVAPDTTDNDGFTVANGASLDLKNSTITLTGTTDNQHGVYAQSGAVAVTLTNNTFVFPVRSASPYSYLISTEGATVVADYPAITLTGTNTQNAYIKLLLVGADTLPNKERYAAEGNKVAIGERLGAMGGTEADGIHVRPATGWNTPVAATAIAGVTPPVKDATPVTTVTAGTGYTGTVTWGGSPSTFASATVYTATITLSATDGYSLVGVTANQFTIDGATSATNSADSGVITAVFPATAAATVSHSSGGGSGPRCSAGTAYNSSTSSCVPVGGAETPATPAVPATHLEGCKPGSSDLFDTTSGKSCTIPATPAGPSSSGLSAPQIQGILDVLASFDADAATIANVRAALSGTGRTTTTTTTGSVTSTAVRVFKANLTMGSLGSEVKALQEFLNSHGYTVSTSGAGSIGHETTFFGRGTSLALIKYQKAKGITPAVGYFGEKTRASVNSGQ